MLGKEGLYLSAEWEVEQCSATFVSAFVICRLQFKLGRTTFAQEVSFQICSA